jgi:hypothetical protein
MTRDAATRRAGGGPHRHTWARRRIGVLALCSGVLSAAALTACSNGDGAALARQACQHVDRSIALYNTSVTTPSAALADARRNQALAQLQQALPLAANAASVAKQFQALMTTLAQGAHLPESDLVHALSAQCAAAQSSSQLGPGPAPGSSLTTPPTSAS